ncbi:hypothetical protein AnigIFM63604_003061 [Aspergillus niger]|uniref:GPI anchored protein n=1 Tax=Aspergillus niger TaxID=5061 RepID=A0A9W5ZZN0_ASPNG|nr:hypothetical protein CBS11852_5190 [Aspergillus niger]KAI2994172.1 hypothetical protein CBS147346_10631 [Aspergillus niger]GLA23323.1 hypothetical protein AnigIFM63326_007913 [Aspergillus niger]GLA48031.1 hypothetical protein AnigIFM63604_003061 [Aspergillus niger]
MLSIPLLACILGLSVAGQASASNVSIPNDSQDTDAIIQHNALIESYLSQKPVRGVHKMTDDEGEKFYLDYWLFDEAYTAGNTSNANDSLSQTQPYNLDTTEKVDFQPRSYPFRPSYPSDLEVERRGWSEHFSPLLRREFKCPSGTYGCSSIDRPESCCSTGDTCVLVKDTGSGDVGCCPKGETCSGTIGSCQDGYSSCSSSLGGGCCIPGYECVTGGCMRVFTITVTYGISLPNRILRLLCRLQWGMLPDRPRLRHDVLPGNALDDFHQRRRNNCSSGSHDYGVDDNNKLARTMRHGLVQLCAIRRRRLLSVGIPVRIQLYGSVNGDGDRGQRAGHKWE